MNEQDGVWRTVGGRRIFIRTGQSLSEAMIRSGKFKTNRNKNKEEEKKDYSKFRIEKNSEGKVIIKDQDGNEINMLSTKEYNKIAEDFADSLNEDETKFVQDYVDCPGWSGELNSSTEDGKGSVRYLYNTTDNNYFTTGYERDTYLIEQGKILKDRFGINGYEDLRRLKDDEQFNNYLDKIGVNKDYGKYDFYDKIERAEKDFKTKEQIEKAKQIYAELNPLEEKFVKYEYDSEEYKQAKEQAEQVRKKYGIELENKSAYYYETVSKYDTENVFNDLEYNMDRLEEEGKLKYINAKQLKELKQSEISPYQYSDFTKRKDQVEKYISNTNKIFDQKGVKLDHDIILFRRGRESEEQISQGFTMTGITSTTYKDSLPKKMPSGLSFGGKEYYIIIPKGTSMCFAEKVIGRGLKSSPEMEKTWNGVRRQHEVMLKPGTSYKYIDSAYIPGKSWDNGRETILLIAKED